jgi:hypothetical protein
MKVRKTQICAVLLTMAFIIGFFSLAHANMGYMNAFVSQYPKSSLATSSNCVVCHTSPPTLNPYGSDFKKNKFGLAAIESMDSDGDKTPNRTEIDNGTYPGDPNSPPPPPPPPATDTAPPTVTSFSIPSSSSSLMVPITSFSATDNVAVTGYMVTESSSKPNASDSGWSNSVPQNYTFTTGGLKALYAFAKDAAGNVSDGLSAMVTITLPPVSDKTPPTVTDFSLPGTADSLSIPINKFTATDNIGVTGYKLTESATTPNASASGWSSSAPSTYAFASGGTKTIYAWAMDAAGNISSSLSATVTITLPTPPPAEGMGIWVGQWFRITSRYSGYLVQGSTLSSQRMSVVGYLRIRSWNPDQNLFEADLYEYDSQSGEWVIDYLPLQLLAGSKLDFICWSQITGDLMSGITARIQGRETNGALSGATLKTLGGYYIGATSGAGDGSEPVGHDAGGLSMSGNLIPEARIPVPSAIVKQ